MTSEYRMTEAQAEAVVNLRLGQLAALERDEILKEFRGLRDLIDRMFGGSSEDLVMSLIKSKQIDAKKIAELTKRLEKEGEK